MSIHSAEARAILDSCIVIDGLGGSVVRPTPVVGQGTTYEELLVSQGWTAFNACLVSEPSYTPSLDETLTAIYENLAYLDGNPRLRLCETLEDIQAAHRTRQLGIFFGLQSPSCIEPDRTRLRILHKLGLRVLQLTYMERNRLGDGCLEPENRGLTSFGMQVIRECNQLGVVVDCSHVGERTTLDAIHCSVDPIIISHTGVRAIADNPRCVTDEQIKAVAAKGGLVGITPYAPFIRVDTRPVLADYLDHIEHVIRLTGVEHVAIATDMFDGKSRVNWVTSHFYPEVTKGCTYDTRRVDGFSRKADLQSVVAGLLGRGHSREAIEKILGSNWLRVIGAVWR